MKTIFRTVLITFCLLFAAGNASAASNNTSVGKSSGKVLRYAASGSHPPFSYTLDSDHVTPQGFEVDLLHMLFDGYDIQAVLKTATEPYSAVIILTVIIALLGLAIIYTVLIVRKKTTLLDLEAKTQVEFSQSIINSSNACIIVTNEEMRIKIANEYFCTLFGVTPKDEYENTLKDFFSDTDDPILTSDLIHQIIDDGQVTNHNTIHFVGSGKVVYLVWTHTLFINSITKKPEIVSFGINVTETKKYESKLETALQESIASLQQLESAESKLRTKYKELELERIINEEMQQKSKVALENSNSILWDLNIETREFSVSANVELLLGYQHQLFTNNYDFFLTLVHPDDLPMFEKVFRGYSDGLLSKINLEFRLRTSTGLDVWFLQSGRFLEGSYSRLSGTLTEITERKLYEQKVYDLAYYDTLTGLPNEQSLQDELNNILFEAAKTQNLTGVLCLDLDDFKDINAVLGHDKSNLLIITISDRIKGLLPDCDLYRVSGDDFVLVKKDCAGIDDLTDTAEKILAIFKNSFSIENHICYTNVSIGIALAPIDGTDMDTIYKNANTALSSAKLLGKATYCLYDANMSTEVSNKLSTEADLRRALQLDGFVLYYQPKVSTESGQVVGAEALIRLNHPKYGIVFPGAFIGIAENTGLIILIGEYVVNEACRQLRSWIDKGYKLFMSVNISAKQFMADDFPQTVKTAVETNGIDPSYLMLEITESIAVHDFNKIHGTILIIKDIGCKVSIDDFGTGYSSLNYLQKMPIDNLKIDKSFLHDAMTEKKAYSIIHSIIMLAHGLELTVTAEGVETEEQVNFLIKNDCNYLQGFYYSPPVPPEKFEKFLNVPLLK